ncbi:MAG: hypothetical protein HYU36_00070, partial [Planctomycetes bacterium]|nr:hypothetical protein [Planctomycetota bacterium]
MAAENHEQSDEETMDAGEGGGGEPSDDDSQAAEIDSLDYVLRYSQWRTRITNYIRATPWWVVSISLHLAAILILGKIVMMTKPPPDEDIIVTTEIKTEELKPLDLKKIEQVFKEMKLVQTEPVVHQPTLINQTVTEVVETTAIETSELVPTVDTTNPTDESFTGVEETGEIGDGAGMGELESTDIIGVGESGFNARGASYKGIMGDLTVRVAGKARGGKYKGNVLLIWLMDASLSMRDDQLAIKERLWEMDKKFREQEGSGQLMQAVVYYSDKPHLWLKPTSDVDQVMKSIE